MAAANRAMAAFRKWVTEPVAGLYCCFVDAWYQSYGGPDVDGMPPSNISNIATLRSHSNEPRN